MRVREERITFRATPREKELIQEAMQKSGLSGIEFFKSLLEGSPREDLEEILSAVERMARQVATLQKSIDITGELLRILIRDMNARLLAEQGFQGDQPTIERELDKMEELLIAEVTDEMLLGSMVSKIQSACGLKMEGP